MENRLPYFPLRERNLGNAAITLALVSLLQITSRASTRGALNQRAVSAAVNGTLSQTSTHPRPTQTTQSDQVLWSVGLTTIAGRSVCGLKIVCQTVCQTVCLLATLSTPFCIQCLDSCCSAQ